MENFIMSNVISKKRRVLNYLSSGRGITAAEARSRFDVKNLRALMSDIRTLVERYDNWEVTTEETRNGGTRYFLRNMRNSSRSFNADVMQPQRQTQASR
jgi:hypothetical protein